MLDINKKREVFKPPFFINFSYLITAGKSGRNRR